MGASITIDELKQVAVGDVIIYKLLPHQLPRDPERVYHGVVKKNVSVAHLFIVTIAEEEKYRDVEDFVRYEQVVQVTKGEEKEQC